MGHALNLRDTYNEIQGVEYAPCWINPYGYLMPLMHNRSALCDAGGLKFPKNYSATFNEAVSVVIRAQW